MKSHIIRRLPWKILLAGLLIPTVGKASFIEATMGTAVVNDATAAYFNPAALTLLKNIQIIGLATSAKSQSEFSGKVSQTRSNFSQTGSSQSQSQYFLPSGYLGIPLSDRLFFGLAIIANNFGRDVDQNSLLRYVMSDNNIQDLDVVPALGFKWNDYLSLGAGLNLSQASFLSTPVSGIPSKNIPDSQSHNEADANAVGGDVGLLLTPSASTQIGLNYRSSMVYHFTGTSRLEGNPTITSNNFSFGYWTPARYVLSVNQFLSRSFGLIGTLQWIKWDIYDKINAKGVVTQIGPNPVILSNASIPLHFHNGWIYTFGGYYKLSSKWIIRTAANYIQSPGNANYQITEGDNIVLGTSIGYKLSKTISIDASYAHAFVRDQTITIQNPINTIDGITKAYRDSVSLKITANV